MSDLDTRLRAYADSWTSAQGPPPDFDSAFERAVATPGRRTTWVWSGLAAACVIALAVIVSLASSSPGSNPARQQPGAPSHSVAGPSSESSISLAERLARQRAAYAAEQAAKQRAMLALIAARQAQIYGDPGATAAAVRTTRAAARFVVGPATAGDPAEQIWVIELRGDFRCGACSPPYGAPHPTGHYLSIFVTARAPYTQFATGLSDNPADLTRLGTPVTLIP